MKKHDVNDTVIGHWIDDGADFHSAKRLTDLGSLVYLVVERLVGTAGWDWQVWDARRQLPSRSGTADTLEAAKADAERVVKEMPYVSRIEHLSQSGPFFQLRASGCGIAPSSTMTGRSDLPSTDRLH